MSFFPDCRHDDCYNEDFLSSSEKDVVFGYDYAVESADSFFDNLDTYFGIDSVMSEFFDRKLPYETDEVFTRRTFTENGTYEEDVPVETYGDLLRAKLLEWLEMNRDEYITSAIDSMDEKEYKKLRKKALSDNEKSDNPKEYYDTRKYAVRGEKESSE